MQYKLEELFAYRFYEKKDGPFVTIRQFNYDEVSKIGCKAGIANIHEIYRNREVIEDLLYRMFIRKGGNPQRTYPYYATVYDKLPDNIQLHVRFTEPECIMIPMNEFNKDYVSFTYGQSPRALTRKDNHPTRRKVLLWDEAEWAINQFQYIDDEGTWLEMQIWEDETLNQFYTNGDGKNIKSFAVEDRISSTQREALMKKYAPLLEIVKSEYFFSPTSVHGVSHAMRVLILANELAEMLEQNDWCKKILIYGSAYHDIGRSNHRAEKTHGYESYKKVESFGLILSEIDLQQREILKFIIENHQIDRSAAKDNIKDYQIQDTEKAYIILNILKDADILDRCRFGHIEKSYLCNQEAKKLVNFAYQLLTIYPEVTLIRG